MLRQPVGYRQKSFRYPQIPTANAAKLLPPHRRTAAPPHRRTAGMPPSLMLGATTVIMPTAPFDAEATLDVIESEGVTSLFLVPAQWQVLCAHPDATRRTRSLRTISWGAAPATVTLLETMAQTFPAAEIISVFGQTEMSPVTTSTAGPV